MVILPGNGAALLEGSLVQLAYVQEAEADNSADMPPTLSDLLQDF